MSFHCYLNKLVRLRIKVVSKVISYLSIIILHYLSLLCITFGTNGTTLICTLRFPNSVSLFIIPSAYHVPFQDFGCPNPVSFQGPVPMSPPSVLLSCTSELCLSAFYIHNFSITPILYILIQFFETFAALISFSNLRIPWM